MNSKDNDIPKISSVNTKKEMLAAYNLLKERIQEQAKAELKPEKAKEEKKEKEIIQAADTVISDGVVKRISDLKVDIGIEFSDIAGKLEKETENYKKVKEAIEVKNKELKEIFEIERSAFSLAALLEAQKQKKIEFEEEMDQRKKFLEEEIKTAKAHWEKEKQQYLQALKEQKREDEKLRQRQKEEYDYTFNREQEKQKGKSQIETVAECCPVGRLYP